MDIGDWLRGLGLERYEPAFRENEIDREALAKLTTDDLRDMGVVLGSHRRKLLEAIRLLDQGQPEAATQTAGASPRVDAERRQLTVMFCDLVGSTALSIRFDPEDLREIVGTYQRAVTNTVSGFSGFVAKYMGDGVLVYFGYPQAHEDDAERAVRAGLGVIDALRDLQLPEALRARIGIASGLVVVGDLLGQGEAQERGVVGETPNLAARLQALAPPDGLIISDSTRRQIGTLFDLQDMGPQPVTGFVEPQQAWRVLRESGVLSRFEALRSTEMPLIGRQEELDLLRRRWRQAKGGEGRVVLMSGEPGIGKSRLTAALMESVAGEPHTRLRYFCSPHHEETALYPFVAQLERAADFAPNDTVEQKRTKLDRLLSNAMKSPQQFALIAELLSLEIGSTPEITPQRKRELLLEAMLIQLRAEAERQPVLMIFEDAQWVDPTSRELLDMVIERIERLPVLLVVTFRPEFQSAWASLRNVAFMALNRLGDGDVTAFVSHLAGNSLLPRETVEEIVERTDGVPLFVEELTKAVLEESGRDHRVAAVLSGSPLRGLVVPASLHASLVARLDRIGGVAKEIAQVGAVLGREFLYELISGATQLRDIDLQAGLASLVHAGLLFCRGTPPHASYLFKHALVQDAAYSTLLRSRRQELHSRVAGLLESRFNEIAERQPELVARHLMAAGLAERAFDYWLRAGKLSLAKSAVREATAQLNRALTLLPNFSEDRRARQELDVLATLGPALISSKGYAAPEVISTLDRARQLIAETRSTGTDLHFFVLYGLCAVLYVAGDPRAMIEEANTFLTLAQSQPATGPVLVGHRLLGTGMMMMGDYTNASGHLEKACQLYDPHEHQHLAVRYGQDIGVSALVYFGWSLWHQGHPEKSKSMIKSAVEHARNCDHTHTLTYALLHAAVGSMLLRELAAATAYADECIALATEHGFPLWRALGQIVSGWALSQQDQASAAAVRIREGLAAAERTGSRWLEPWFMGLLAQALGSAGQLNDAKIIVQDALERAAVSGQQCADAELNRIGGELNSLLGSNLAESDRQLSLAVNVARRQGSIGFELRTAISLARLWNEQGRQTQARDLLEPIYGRFTEGRDTVDLKEAKALLDNLN